MRSTRSRVGAFLAVTAVSIPAVMAGTSTVTAAAPAAASAGAVAGAVVRQIDLGGTTVPRGSAPGSAQIADPELRPEPGGEGDRAGRGASMLTATPGVASDAARAAAAARLGTSFDGLNHFQNRTANGGNQFSLEPPDQGLCVGNGKVLETVNDVLRVYDTGGKPLSKVVSLSEFYNYPPAINRTTGRAGPFVTDPSCYFDADTNRWFHVVLTLDVDPATGAFLGSNHLDIAVSRTGNPLGSWNIYRLDVTDDGTHGTPNHHCSLNADGTGHGPCIGDYPHLGVDANGFFVTTNEYAFFGPEFHGAQVYAFSKAALAHGNSRVSVWQWDTKGAGPGHEPGFTLAPATTPGGQYETGSRGTEYFLSSDAGEETGNTTGTSSNLITWGLTNTRSLDGGAGQPALSRVVNHVAAYTVPSHSEQKQGPAPLKDCLNDAIQPTPFGRGCWQYLFAAGGPFNETIGNLDSSDTRMHQATFQGGHLWGALDTAALVNGRNQASIAWYMVTPHSSGGIITATVTRQGVLASAGTNLIYPAIGMTAAGKGVMAFTLVGRGDYPSAAYATIGAGGVGPIQVAAAGVGPQDGFSEYTAFANPGSPARPRWGDYGASAVVGGTVWIASEYIAQACGIHEYMQVDPATGLFGTCHNTRTALANWGTRVSAVTP